MDPLPGPRAARTLGLILGASLCLRVYLVLAGGALFLPDEAQYTRARIAAEAALSGDLGGFLDQLRYADHFGNTVIFVVPAALAGSLWPSPKLPALLFTLFGVVNIWLVWKIALRAGAARREALAAAFLMSASTTFLYYARHLLPYDPAVTLGLLALLVALRKSPGDRDACACGLLSSACFLVYPGYWTLAGFALLVQAVYDSRDVKAVVRRAVVSGTCLVAPFAVITVLDALFGGNLFLQFIWFTRTITQGVYAEGWRLPIEYLWHAEHFLFVLWAAALASCLWEARRGALPASAAIGVAGVLFIYGTLVLFSVGIEKFVVYGRLVRQCVPFFCLLTAHALERIARSPALGRKALAALTVLILIQAGVNFERPLTQVFPADFRKRAEAIVARQPEGRYELVNARYIYPAPDRAPRKPHEVVLEAPHPLAFLPYQYEGYTPEQRARLREADLRMRLVRYPPK